MKKLGEINEEKQTKLRFRRFDLLEPGKATFKVGGEAADIRGKIAGGDGESVFADELNVPGIGENIVLND